MKRTFSLFVPLIAITMCGLHASADAFDKDKGKPKAKPPVKQHWNPAPPKKNFRHDNRNWNKQQKVWRKLPDGTRYQYDGRYYYWNGTRYNSLAALSARRQQTKNEWRNLAIAGGLVAALGLLKDDQTLVFAGAAGALYSLYRYEQDRKSQSQVDRLRAYYFSQPYFYRDGVRYTRRVMIKNGEKHYQFVRST